jgi:hypothetical protein
MADFALASIVVSGVATTMLIVGVYRIDRGRQPDEVAPRTTTRPTHTVSASLSSD